MNKKELINDCMNKDFRNYNEAKKYADEIRNNGLKSYIEEFYDFDGRFYTVLVW